MINIDLTAITVIYGTFFAFWEHIKVFDIKRRNNVSLFKANIDGLSECRQNTTDKI